MRRCRAIHCRRSTKAPPARTAFITLANAKSLPSLRRSLTAMVTRSPRHPCAHTRAACLHARRHALHRTSHRTETGTGHPQPPRTPPTPHGHLSRSRHTTVAMSPPTCRHAVSTWQLLSLLPHRREAATLQCRCMEAGHRRHLAGPPLRCQNRVQPPPAGRSQPVTSLWPAIATSNKLLPVHSQL
jgi:hypothetical protein